MNPDTNQLVDLRGEALERIQEEAALGQLQDDLAALVDERAARRLEALGKQGFVGLPAELDHAARCALQGEVRTTVSRQSKGKLSKWAASQRGARRRGGR